MRLKPIVMCFAILDEEDIVEYFIEHHLSIGVDAFVGVDLGSKDGTLEKLAAYEERDLLHLTRLAAPDAYERDDHIRFVKTAQRVFDAQWCLTADPDEFWVVPNHDLPQYLGALPTSIVTVPRYNFLPERTHGSELKHFSELSLLVRRPLEFNYGSELAPDKVASIDREDATALLWRYPPEILRWVQAKVAARATVVKKFVPGAHNVEPIDDATQRQHADDAYIAHVPFRSLEQFRRKARDVFRCVERNLPEYSALVPPHWIRLHALHRHHLVEEEFGRQILDETTIAQYLADGTVARDEVLAQRLRQLSVQGSPRSREEAFLDVLGGRSPKQASAGKG